jgi:hypothetical protein
MVIVWYGLCFQLKLDTVKHISCINNYTAVLCMVVVFSCFFVTLDFFVTLSKCLSDLVHYGYYVLVAYQFQELLYWCLVAFFFFFSCITVNDGWCFIGILVSLICKCDVYKIEMELNFLQGLCLKRDISEIIWTSVLCKYSTDLWWKCAWC